jgi:hypothetical protein
MITSAVPEADTDERFREGKVEEAKATEDRLTQSSGHTSR